VPASFELLEKYGDKMALIFVESQGTARDVMEGVVWNRKWMGRGGMWTTERPFSSGSRSLPSFILLSREGKVILKGHPLSLKKEIEKVVASEAAKWGKPPEGMPKTLRTTWLEFERERYTRAFVAAKKVAEAGTEDSSAAEKTLKTFRRRIEAKFEQVTWLIDNGYLIKADDMAESLVKALKGNEEFEPRAREMRARLGSQELKQEMAAARALGRIEKKLMSDGLTSSVADKLRKFATNQEGTMAAKRAVYLAALAGSSTK